jgi:hypothetical protein
MTMRHALTSSYFPQYMSMLTVPSVAMALWNNDKMLRLCAPLDFAPRWLLRSPCHPAPVRAQNLLLGK